MGSKSEKSIFDHRSIKAWSDVNDFSLTSRIILRRDEICLFKDICPFNTSYHRCYGTVERNNDFVCDLKNLKSMYKTAVE
jgi:hypothetical protein